MRGSVITEAAATCGSGHAEGAGKRLDSGFTVKAQLAEPAGYQAMWTELGVTKVTQRF